MEPLQDAVSQESVAVQFWVLQQLDLGVWVQEPPEQESWVQELLSSQFLAVPEQVPPEQVSLSVQALPSSQEPDLGV